MRLLKRASDGNICLTRFDDDNVPRYAVLSHTWTDGEEVTYTELVSHTGTNKTGYDKIRFCVDRAADDGIEYSWVDTCCIDRSTSDELGTAINSMFRWYQKAAKCYVYLSDVEVPEEVDDAEAFPVTWSDAFRRSRWFTRGWTLQELLAPATVEFFSQEQKRLGSKISLEREIHQITKIPIEALRWGRLSDFSTDERMHWAAQRKTTRKEDKAYCLLGVFGVHLPLNYGEGENYAMLRLQEEVEKRQRRPGMTTLQSLAVPSSLPFPRNQLFSGRENQLRMLEQSLFYADGHQRMSIYGLGGCGKSAIAIEFAYRAMAADAERLVFWVPAISHQSFELAYRDIGVRLRLPGIADDNADIKKLVKDAMGSNNRRAWLMVVDNADDLDVLMQRADSAPGSTRLYDYLPHSDKGKILFTTRSRKAAESLTPSNVLELQDMDKVESTQLLSRRVSKKTWLQNDETVVELLEALTYLPLAIVQAAAFINNNDVSVSDYVSLLREPGTDAELFSERFEDLSRYPDMDSTVAKTWFISFNQVRRHDPLAAEYLSFMACINRIGIPQSMLPPSDSRLKRVKAIGTLKSYAFITERQQIGQDLENERFFDMHRLVHMASERWLDDHNEWSTWTTKAAMRLEELTRNGAYEANEIWANYLPHGMHVANGKRSLDPLVRASLFHRLGRCQVLLGRYVGAEVTQKQALALREAVLGPAHPDTLMSQRSLATALHLQDRFQEAEAMYRLIVERCQAVLGLEHPETLASTSWLAAVLRDQERYQEAEALVRHVLESTSMALGPEHPSALMDTGILAFALHRQGRYEEADALNRQALKRSETTFGPVHPATVALMSSHALMLQDRGKYQEAEVMMRQTLECEKTELGLQHPDTLTTTVNLALFMSWQGRVQEAEVLHRQALEGREAVLGPKHADTLRSMHDLANLLATLQRREEAIHLLRRALAGLTAILGEDHSDTQQCHEDYIKLSGKVPFEAASISDSISKHTTEAPQG